MGLCLVSQEIRKKIIDGSIITTTKNLELLDKPDVEKKKKKGWFVDDDLENRVQPSSFDPIIGNQVFEIDTKTEGLFRPNKNEPIYRTLMRLPNLRRPEKDITGGYEVKTDFSYLFHLEEKLIVREGEHVKSSPKSSPGRLFLNTRLLADFSPSFNEINCRYVKDREIDLWLLVQSPAFNVIVHPGISLNQLRFLEGYDAKLTPEELRKELARDPILFEKSEDGLLIPAEQVVTTEGLEIHLDLLGKDTNGIVGLRARQNPNPIDLTKEGEYKAEEYFEPVKAEERKTRNYRGERYLLASSQILVTPLLRNIELRRNSDIGFSGPIDFAGFVDNTFTGNLVFEAILHEQSDMTLEHGTPITVLDVFRTNMPDKTYGEESNSHYQEQGGVRPPKYFGGFNFPRAARDFKGLEHSVLVEDAKIFKRHREHKQGFEFLNLDSDRAIALFEDIKNGFFQSRYDCEDDELILQVIPYVLVFVPPEGIFAYVRAKEMEKYLEKELFSKHSIGLGGHIIKSDGPNYFEECINREVLNTEIEIQGNYSKPRFVGTLMAYDKPIDRVHFGLVYRIHAEGIVVPKGESIESGGIRSIKDLMKEDHTEYETWSKILIPKLPAIKEA